MLRFIASALERIPSRAVSFGEGTMPKVDGYSDAEFTPNSPIGFGWTVFLPGCVPRAACSTVPLSIQRLWLKRKTQIHIAEVLAAVSLVFTLSSELSGMRLWHFVDNQGALANLIAGSAAAMDIAGAIAAYHLIAVKHGIMPWLEYVESDLNVSDGPSRELENFALSITAAKLGITMMERAKS